MADSQPTAGSGGIPLDPSAMPPFGAADSLADQAAIDELLKQASFDDPTPAPAASTPDPFAGQIEVGSPGTELEFAL